MGGGADSELNRKSSDHRFTIEGAVQLCLTWSLLPVSLYDTVGIGFPNEINSSVCNRRERLGFALGRHHDASSGELPEGRSMERISIAEIERRA